MKRLHAARMIIGVSTFDEINCHEARDRARYEALGAGQTITTRGSARIISSMVNNN